MASASSPASHYDQHLLAITPAATKAQLQEGYTTDLLNPSSGKITPPHVTQSDLESGLIVKEHHEEIPSRPVPFWRTKKGIIIICVAAIIIIGAVVGGAAGGTAGKKKAPQDPSQQQPISTDGLGATPTDQSQGVSPSTSVSTTTSSSPATTSPPVSGQDQSQQGQQSTSSKPGNPQLGLAVGIKDIVD